MRLTFIIPARVSQRTSDAEASLPEAFNGSLVAEDHLKNYLDSCLADLGIVGGEIRLAFRSGSIYLQVIFWIPEGIPEQVIEKLRCDTLSQLEDGIGEGGFEFDSVDERLIITAEVDSTVVTELVDDGRNVSGPSQIAVAARDGDIAALASSIQQNRRLIDTRYQGYTGLHFAILFGHLDAVRMLLEAGADPNHLDPQDMTPLELCMLSNSLDDQQSRLCAKMLLDSGANANHVAPDGESAKTYAEARGKYRAAELLYQW